jgi:putative salt-induced outer membrane protein YdiY
MLLRLIFLFTLVTVLFFSVVVTTYAENKVQEDWKTPTPIFKQEFDWLRLTSNEWLKGEIVSMYDDVLEFDSDELGIQSIDWDDVAELRSKDVLSIRMNNNIITEGRLLVLDGKLTVVSHGSPLSFQLKNLLSIASSGENEWDLWDGYTNLGLNVSDGNSSQFDYTITAGIQRRSSVSRFTVDYTGNHSETEQTLEDGTKEDVVTANSLRLVSKFDWFFSQSMFIRLADAEFYSDEFVNVDSRMSYGVALGYHFIENKLTSWEVTLGPSYQTTTFIEVAEGSSITETSPALSVGTAFDHEITSDIDYAFLYEARFVNEESGDLIHKMQTGLQFELTNNLDFDFTFYLDRTENPRANELDEVPEKNDYRLVVSLGYDF